MDAVSSPTVAVIGGGIAGPAGVRAILSESGLELVPDEEADVVVVVVHAGGKIGLDQLPQTSVPLVLVVPDEHPLGELRSVLRIRLATVVAIAKVDQLLVSAIHVAHLGAAALPTKLLAALLENAEPGIDPQEAAWLRSLNAGRTVLDLAVSSGFSERSMYRRLAALYDRLGVSNRRQAFDEIQRRQIGIHDS